LKKIKNQRKQYLQKSRKSWSFRTFVAESSSTKMLATFGESEEAVKKFYGANLSIYRGEGGSFKKLPRYDHCEKSGGHVSTPTF
jgi:hypothetical protein